MSGPFFGIHQDVENHPTQFVVRGTSIGHILTRCTPPSFKAGIAAPDAHQVRLLCAIDSARKWGSGEIGCPSVGLGTIRTTTTPTPPLRQMNL